MSRVLSRVARQHPCRELVKVTRGYRRSRSNQPFSRSASRCCCARWRLIDRRRESQPLEGSSCATRRYSVTRSATSRCRSVSDAADSSGRCSMVCNITALNLAPGVAPDAAGGSSAARRLAAALVRALALSAERVVSRHHQAEPRYRQASLGPPLAESVRRQLSATTSPVGEGLRMNRRAPARP